ncbi:MAG: TM1812 family CRISPR-associated protein [Bacteroidia bacterium]
MFGRCGKRSNGDLFFYGAFELSKDYFQGFGPILDLTPMFHLLDWLTAAQAFKDYGDILPVTKLMESVLSPEAFLRFKQRAMRLPGRYSYMEITHIPQKRGHFLPISMGFRLRISHLQPFP